MDYDLKITGGTIVDGTGKPGYRGDVGIKDGKVVALGKAPGTARRTIDAKGKVVAPGFIDIHTHYDAQVIWDRMMSISPWHGVTTVVMGNCGFSVAPTRPEHRDLIMRTLENVEGMSVNALRAGLGEDWGFETFPEYLDAIERRGTAINVGAMIGHTALRMYVMGKDATEREATPDEVARMRALVGEALKAGAVGFATSKAVTHIGYAGKPVASRFANFDETREIARAISDAGTGMMQVTIGHGMSFEEFATVAEDNDCHVSWTALLAMRKGGLGMGDSRSQLEKSHALVERGAKVFPQVMCRPLNFEFQFRAPFIFESMPVFKPVSAETTLEGRKRIYSDPGWRTQFKEAIARAGIADGWSDAVISQHDPEPSLNERRLADVAAERGVDPSDLALDLALENELQTRFRVPVANRDEEELQTLLIDPITVLGLSDAGAHASQLCDACFSTYLLRYWVREKGVLSLEEGVRMLTTRPAEVFGIKDRGRLAIGVPADVVVFDADTVGDGKLERVYDLPAGEDRLISRASGIEAVVVNGVLIREHGQDMVDPDGPLPGKLLRHGPAHSSARQIQSSAA